MKNIAILYSHFPRYRKPIFDALRQSENYRFHFYYGNNDFGRGIKMSSAYHKDNTVKSYRIGKFIIQKGFMREALGDKFDAIIFLGNPYIITNWIYAISARLTGKKVLYWTHGWLSNEKGMRSFARMAYYRLSNSLLLYGERAKKIGIGKGIDEKRLKVIYNSLDYDMQKLVRIHTKISVHKIDDTNIFLYVGRLIPESDLGVAIRALALLQSQGHRVALEVIGDGEERKTLEDMAKENRVDARFLGECYDEYQIGRHMLSATAVVSPGKVGLLAMHSLAYGTPVITHGNFDTQMPEFEAIVEGRTGGFFIKGDHIDMARVMKNWIACERSERPLNEAISTIEERYNPFSQLKAIENALDELFEA